MIEKNGEKFISMSELMAAFQNIFNSTHSPTPPQTTTVLTPNPLRHSLHIGLNKVNPASYGGWDGKLSGCVNDAKFMETFAKAYGFNTELYLNEDAICMRIFAKLNQFRNLAKEHPENSYEFLITNSSHGGQVPDSNGDETDGRDETICMYDGQILDDELAEAFRAFPKNATIIFISDSCHSGTVTRTNMSIAPAKHKRMPHSAMLSDKKLHTIRDYFKSLRKVSPLTEPDADIIAIGACADNQYSYDGVDNGAFTGTFKNKWKDNSFSGSLVTLYKLICKSMPDNQSPTISYHGPTAQEYANRPLFK